MSFFRCIKHGIGYEGCYDCIKQLFENYQKLLELVKVIERRGCLEYYASDHCVSCDANRVLKEIGEI
jgi:hypothetical protein